MQNTSSAYSQAYEKAFSLYSQPKVTINWNHNRFSETVTASNAGDTTEDENFPITSIVQSLRDGRGVVKARVGEARTYKASEDHAPQYRTVGPRSNYKYWTSVASSSSGALTDVRPQVIYGSAVKTNKITVSIENTVSAPNTWSLQITTNGTNWTTIANQSNATINPSTGRLIVYLQSGGAWTQTYNINNSTPILGVRFYVTRVEEPYSHLNLIEIAAHLERDISDVVMTTSTSRSTAEASMIFPVGSMTSNTASISIDNTDMRFDRDNTSSDLYGLIDTNAEVKIWLGTDVSPYGGSMEYVPQGTFYVDSWGDDTAGATLDITCTDFSKFFQQMQMEPVLYQNRTPSQIVGEILSSVGYRNYALDLSNDEGQTKIPYVWFTNEDNVWGALQSICESTQGTLFSDEQGVIRYRSREATFENAADVPDFIASAENAGTTLANLASVEHNFEVEANKVTVNFKPLIANARKVPVDKVFELDLPFRQTRRYNRREYESIPIDSVLWKPESTISLRAADLTETLSPTGTYFKILERNADKWPWTGHVNIEGEVISYDGKEYRWFNNGQQQLTIVKSQEEQTKIDDMQSDIATRHKNAYTGRFENLSRGLLGTAPANHYVGIGDWTAYRKNSNGTVDHTPTRAYVRESHLVIKGYSGDNNETYTSAMRGLYSDNYAMYGTRLRFADAAYTQGTAGMFWNMQSDRKQAYYIEVNLVSHTTNMKGSIAQIRVYRMNSDGSRTALPHATNDAYGIDYPVVKAAWYSLDVVKTGAGAFNIYLDGRMVHSFTDPRPALAPGTWGPFVRGYSVAEFEYFYVANNGDGVIPDIEASSFTHKVFGSYVSGFADRKISKENGTVVDWYFDDFGPWAHEMRKFQVEFDKVPALDANVFMTNTWDAYLIDSNRTAFDAAFWIANSGRDTAVLSGEDPSIYIGGGDMKQQLLVYGQLVTEDEESSVSVTNGDYRTNPENENTLIYSNEYAIRKRGEVELTVDSKWIQSKSQAESLGEWITKHWSEPVDNITVSGYFPPTVQLGDLVAINYPDRHMLPELHRYHVVGVESGYSEGIDVSLTLRRVR